MSFPTAPGAAQYSGNFIPEIWNAQLLSSLKKSLIFGGPGVANRNYEGNISAVGDTVKITSIS
ncbi:hypothetical protein K0U83_15695, partial [bacterium]|nr:hypothetical protein [bacterium]